MPDEEQPSSQAIAWLLLLIKSKFKEVEKERSGVCWSVAVFTLVTGQGADYGLDVK
jgi:hypothetical protein